MITSNNNFFQSLLEMKGGEKKCSSASWLLLSAGLDSWNTTRSYRCSKISRRGFAPSPNWPTCSSLPHWASFSFLLFIWTNSSPKSLMGDKSSDHPLHALCWVAAVVGMRFACGQARGPAVTASPNCILAWVCRDAEILPSYFIPVMVSVLAAAAEKSLLWNQTEPESVIELHHKRVTFRQQIQFPVEQPCPCWVKLPVPVFSVFSWSLEL